MSEFRISTRGRLPGDIWQFGFMLQYDGFASDLANTVASQWQAMLTPSLQADMNTGVIWDSVVASQLTTGSGVVVESAEAPIGRAGTASVGMMPPQCSVCVTILGIGTTTKGRFYLPPFNQGCLTSAGRLATSKRDAWADALDGFFGGLGGASSPARLGIWRTSSQSFIGAQGISIGDVIDTQRRRRNKLIEARTERFTL